MATEQNVIQDAIAYAVERAPELMQRWGVTAEIALRYLIADAILRRLRDRAAPAIISGYRSKERQDELRRRWDAGDRRGLSYRPAENSRHETGRALDVEPRDEEFAFLWRAMGGRDGATFTTPDPDHFDA
jgi:hypothetical protein